MSDESLLQLAEGVLARVGDRAEAVVRASDADEGLTRFARSFIHQHVGSRRREVWLQVALAGRSAEGSTTSLDEAGLERLVETTLEAASLRPPEPSWPGVAPPAALPPGVAAGEQDRPSDNDPDARAAVVGGFVSAAGGLETAGYCETVLLTAALATSAGQRVVSSSRHAALDGIARAGGADGCASRMLAELADLDGAAAGRRAAEVARRQQDPIELPPGRYPVLLAPRCVASMLDFLSLYAFNAKAVAEGRSAVVPGEDQFDPSLSLWDDATDARQVGLAFDAEGTPKVRTPLVESGRVVGLAHDRRTAAAAGVVSSGQAVSGGATLGPVATNLFLAGAAPRPVAELVAGIERGLLVNDFWYTRVVDPRTLVVTGLTRNGVFLVTDGEIGPAVGNLRFTQSPAAAWGPGGVIGVGDDATLAPGGLHLAWHHVPSLALASWNFTGNASG